MEVLKLTEWTRKWAQHSREIFDAFAFNGYSDATICCDGKRIPVHKLMLVSASDYFREILESTPASHPIIIIENVDLSVLESLLMFIYRGEIIVHSSETPALFKLAREFKIKGLSGHIGTDTNLLYDSKPQGMEVLNLNMFRKYINPCLGQTVLHLCFQINQIICAQKIYENRRRNRMEASSSSSADQSIKTNVVKDNKYKSVVRNRASIYVKEGGSDALTETKEEEICNRLGNISLVKDASQSFSEEAVKDLVVRLNSTLSLEDQEKKETEETPATSDDALPCSSKEKQEEESGTESPDSRIHDCTRKNLTKSDLLFAQMETLDYTKIVNLMSDPSYERAPESDPRPAEEVPMVQLLNGEELKIVLNEQSATRVTTHRCNECEFETSRSNIIYLHRKFHAYEKIKYKYNQLKEVKLEEFLRRKAGLPISKSSGSKSLGDKVGEGNSGAASGSKCRNCNIEFETDHELLAHLTSHKHPGVNTGSKFSVRKSSQSRSRGGFSKKRAYICLFCSYRSYDIQSLNEHRKSHTYKKLLSCELCPNRTAKLCIHKLTSGEKLLRCTQCSYRCTTPKLLVIHVKKHEHESKKETKLKSG